MDCFQIIRFFLNLNFAYMGFISFIYEIAKRILFIMIFENQSWEVNKTDNNY
jgi:hypothetical protein